MFRLLILVEMQELWFLLLIASTAMSKILVMPLFLVNVFPKYCERIHFVFNFVTDEDL